MASRRKASGKTRRRGLGPVVPTWLLILLVAALLVAVLLRLKVLPLKHAPPAKVPAPSAAPPKPPAREQTKKSAERQPPVVPETPRESGAVPSPPKPPPSPHGVPTVSLVIDDVGYRLDLVEEATKKLPPAVTFAIIPFLPESEPSARALHDRDFPVILHCPMEPEHAERWKPTPGMLAVGMPPSEVDAILTADLRAVLYAEGINNHMGSLATADRPLMDAVVSSLKARRLYFLDSRTTPATVGFDTARSSGVPSAFRSVFLDDVDDEGAIMKQFDTLVSRAGKEGILVAIGHLRPKTIAVLAERIPYWKVRGVQFVPLKEVVR